MPDRDRWTTLLDPICELYDAVFSAAPHSWTDSDDHRRMMQRMIADADFGLTVAETSNRLIGFAYGYPLRNDGWWRGFQRPVPAEVTKEWPGRTFAIIDIAVTEDHRRQGIGTRLMESLLSDRKEERATLAVIPAAVDAHAFYERLGWQLVGRQDSPPDSGWLSPQFDVYVRSLPTR